MRTIIKHAERLMIDKKYSIVEQLTPDQIDQLHEMYKEMWWSKDRSREEIDIMLETCMVFALIDQETGQLGGFARVLTDRIRYAYIYDVMVQKHLRGIGIGKMIMNMITSHPTLQHLKYFELTCAPELANYYKRFHFNEDYGNVIAMRCKKNIF